MCRARSENKTDLVISPLARPALVVDNSMFVSSCPGQNIDNTMAQISLNVEEKRKLFEKPSILKSKGLSKVKTKKWVKKKDGTHVLPFDLFTPLKRLLSFNKENILEYNLLAFITKPGFVLLSLLLKQG